jgi:hypothetical protein
MNKFGMFTSKEDGGCRYSGTWCDDAPHGAGRMEYPDGGCYVGEMSDGCRHGVGRRMLRAGKDACAYLGEWVDGSRHGYVAVAARSFIGCWLGSREA